MFLKKKDAATFVSKNEYAQTSVRFFAAILTGLKNSLKDATFDEGINGC